jgi:opacity protein-like surface antigen
MKNVKNVFMAVIIMTVVAMASTGNAENNRFSWSLSELGVVFGHGSGNISEGVYRTELMICHIGFNLKEFSSGSPEGRKNTLTFFLEPQINPSFSPSTDVEFGAGLGLKYRYHLTEWLSAYGMASIGPHWMTLQTADQVSGFMFCEMIGVGLSMFVTDRSALNLEFRARHISNGGLKEPNGGLDACFGAVGYSVFF